MRFSRRLALCAAAAVGLMATSLVAQQAVPIPQSGGEARADREGQANPELDEALERLRLHPKDAYLQYAVLQMARGTDQFEQVSQEVRRLVQGSGFQPGGRQQVNAFGIFSGALAIQESLQLDRLTPDTNGDDMAQGPANIAISTLSGPTIKSHPWEEMLAGREPKVSRLSQCVPADFFFVEARSVSKLLELKEAADLWAGHVMTQATGSARTQLAADRILEQLALDADDPLRTFYDAAVRRVAITGSDLFFREGTDVTLLFEVQQPALFRTRMELFSQAAQERHPSAKRTSGEVDGLKYVHLGSPDAKVHVFAAEPFPDLFIRSNSLAALRRIAATIRGRSGQDSQVEALGDTLEFQYIRTLMETDAAEEDVLIYLSDPFIRRLVGPELKLTELRRMVCYNNMRMLGHAALLHCTRVGDKPSSLAELIERGFAPEDFLTGEFRCPDGGQYSLAADAICSCSHHGHAQAMVPCLESPVTQVTTQEAAAYRTFLEQYNEYWRQFFDPIAIRVQSTPEQYRAETIILPLIDNTLYTGLSRAFNGEPEALDHGPIPERNIFTAAVRLNKAEIARTMGFEELLAPEDRGDPPADASAASVGAKLRDLALAMHNHHDVQGAFPPPDDSQLSWRVHVLPFIGEGELHSKFRFDEPWDSPHNRALVSEIPDLFKPANPELARAGKTQIMQPFGEGLFLPSHDAGIGMAQVTDGMSNTIMLVEAAEEHADIWSKPADLAIDPAKPAARLNEHPPGGFVAAFADGSVHFLRTTAPSATMAALMTASGGEQMVNLSTHEMVLRLPSRRGPGRQPFWRDEALELGLGQFLVNGIGNQVGVHLYDSDPLIGFSTPEFIGSVVQGMSRSGRIDDDWSFIGLFVAAATSPVYISVPVQDRQIVDDFLVGLDEYLAKFTRTSGEGGGFFRIEQDFYRWQAAPGTEPRAIALQFGPLTFRFFWSRIEDTLYIASKPFILEDLLAAQDPPKSDAMADAAATGHAMIRMRPEHWDEVLSSFHLGWTETHREACLDNLGPLTSVHRALAAEGNVTDSKSLHHAAAEVYDAHFFCPAGGHYSTSEDGREVVCTVHGSALAPRQPVRVPADTALGKFMREFERLTMTLTFTEDGLHAVVTIERK